MKFVYQSVHHTVLLCFIRHENLPNFEQSIYLKLYQNKLQFETGTHGTCTTHSGNLNIGRHNYPWLFTSMVATFQMSKNLAPMLRQQRNITHIHTLELHCCLISFLHFSKNVPLHSVNENAEISPCTLLPL